MGDQAPDLTRKVIGYRVWVPRNDRVLNSAICPTAWARGTNTAVCRPPFGGGPGRESHEAPLAGCNCGFYALHDVATARIRHDSRPVPYASSVIGAVAAWGRLEVHHGGFRAQHAEIVALGYESEIDEEPARACAENYGVPCVPLDQLDDVAQAHGSPVPEGLRPKPLIGNAGTGGTPHAIAWGYGLSVTSSWSVTPGPYYHGRGTAVDFGNSASSTRAQPTRRRSRRVGNRLLALALAAFVVAYVHRHGRA